MLLFNKNKIKGEKMTDETKKPIENEEEQIKETGKNFADKAGDTFEKVSESAKVASEKASDTFEKVSQGAKVAGEKAVDAFDNFAESAKVAGVKAGEVLEDLAETTKLASKKAGEKASEVAGTVLSGMKKMGEKATDAVEILEIKREISKLESEIKSIIPQVSDQVLALYAENKLKESALVELCNQIKKNKELIQEKLTHIETIKKSESE